MSDCSSIRKGYIRERTRQSTVQMSPIRRNRTESRQLVELIKSHFISDIKHQRNLSRGDLDKRRRSRDLERERLSLNL